MYGIYMTLASALLLAYVLWRASSLPFLRKIPRRAFLIAWLLLTLVLIIERWLEHGAFGPWTVLLGFFSWTLVGTLLLVFVCLFPADLLLGFGRFFPRRAAAIRGWAMLAGCLLALLALFQGLRPPLIVRYEVRLPGLPPALDGTTLACISDFHLGTLIGPGWLEARVAQINALKPDMVLELGDVFEGHGEPTAAYLPALDKLSAPLGVWAVEGNHEMHGGRPAAEGSTGAVPLRTLRDETVQPAPGLFIAGRRSRHHPGWEEVRTAWNPDAKHFRGGMVLMSHVPIAAEAAARAGVGLMLSGHTHGGQLWPWSIATKMLNPLIAGRYEFGGMTLLVTRGAGTWGPRMRLWRPGEIMLVTLRSPLGAALTIRGIPDINKKNAKKELKMKKRIAVFSVLVCVALLFCACGKSPQAPAGESAASQPAESPSASSPATAPAGTGLRNIADMSEAWGALYKQNEKAINDYDGMPIMGLVTPPLTFVASVQFDMLNMDNKDGRFEGQLMLAGYKGFVEKAGPKITFGYDDKLAKDGFGPNAKAGDRTVSNGSLALDKEYYICETFTERAGRKIDRSYYEFKRVPDGSMVCLALSGHVFNFRGDEEPGDEVIYLHNGAGRYDFVIAKGKTGPEFKAISFADKGDLTKEQALELFKAAGYTIETSGGIQGGKLVVDK
jgi:predicted MPP superfamily phosphohydrolase